MSVERRRLMIEPSHPKLSIVQQCALVSISRSGFYYVPAGESPLNLALMRLIDEAFLECPFYGARQMARHLRRQGDLLPLGSRSWYESPSRGETDDEEEQV